jgi:uncharacterized protein (TIGR02246 family)
MPKANMTHGTRGLATLTICLMLGAAGASQEPTTNRATDAVAVNEIVKRYVDARERADAKAIAALFTSDADQLVSSGEWRRGREEVVMGTLASSKQTGGKRTITVETIRFPSADTAIADGRYEITGGATGDRRMWTTFVMTRTKDGWRIAAIRNMLPAPPA